MDFVLLDDIKFKADLNQLFKTLRVDESGEDAQAIKRMVDEAEAIARPKVLYKVAYIESKYPDSVIIEGIKLTSRVMSVNLKDVHRVFPYVATCGTELENWSTSISDILENFWADAIKVQALQQAMKCFDQHVEQNLSPGKTSNMNPGSLKDWPISEQKSLFQILGDVKGLTGVSLTESFLMTPIKSVSGIKFPTETGYENCKLCPRENCIGRRAPYDKDLYNKNYT
ncbi:MAG: vitamin B12 dependent-methionine synthase activation domain-containing protein [Acetivibrionales bacterium]